MAGGGQQVVYNGEVMAGYRAAASETGDAQMSKGPHGERPRDWYARMEMGDA